MKTETRKLYSIEPSEYFCQISAKSIRTISSYIVSKFESWAVFRHSVVTFLILSITVIVRMSW